MARKESLMGGKPGYVYVARHLENDKPSGYYVIASAIKQTVEQRIKYETARYPTTELMASFQTNDAGVAEREARNRLCDIVMGLTRRYPDKRKSVQSNSEWLYNENNRQEAEIIACVKETCEEYSSQSIPSNVVDASSKVI